MSYIKYLLIGLFCITACSKRVEQKTEYEYIPRYDYIYIFCGTKLMMSSRALCSKPTEGGGADNSNRFLKFDPGLYWWTDETGNSHVQYIGEGWSVHRSSSPSSFNFIPQ